MTRFFLTVLFALTLTAHASNNVLLIIADDYGIDASALYNTAPGAQFAPTPNIASLAANGIKFTNAYGYPLCSPARSSILTGRQGYRTGTANVVGGGTSNNTLKAAGEVPCVQGIDAEEVGLAVNQAAGILHAAGCVSAT